MMSETTFGIYYWGIYAWFVIGVALIGIPAIVQIIKVIRNK
jgi:hypothetical protein